MIMEDATTGSREQKQGDEESSLSQLYDSNSTDLSAIPSVKREDLCQLCKRVNLDRVFNMKVNKRIRLDRGKVVMDLNATKKELEDSDCALCNLFACAAPSVQYEEDPGSRLKCQVRAFSAGKVFIGPDSYEFLKNDTILLGVVQVGVDAKSGKISAYGDIMDRAKDAGFLLSSLQSKMIESSFGIRRISPEHFDIGFAKTCLRNCEDHDCCKTEISDSALSSFFKVIDCNTGMVVKAPPSCRYVALSYLWGIAQEAKDAQNQQSIFSFCPKVIRDSTEVTLNLGFQYLWVDRYCINQSDDTDKHNQIRQMDLIYMNAQVTIIAAAGVDPHYGLPGVNGTLRKQQPFLKIGRHILAWTLPHPAVSVGQSKWATRGWTYQEGILSKRRLIFTDRQLLFECNGMHRTESVMVPLNAMTEKNTKVFRWDIPSGAFAWKTPGSEPNDAMRYISEFSRRELTYPEDRLNAMKGIFHLFERSKLPIYQITGVPILPTTNRENDYFRHKRERTAEQSFLVGLTWRPERAGKRDPYFSSWSWAGWTGTLYF
jgi:hypothetical protein